MPTAPPILGRFNRDGLLRLVDHHGENFGLRFPKQVTAPGRAILRLRTPV